MSINVEEVEETRKIRRERLQCDKCKTVCADAKAANGWHIAAKLELHTIPGTGTHIGVGGTDPYAQFHLCPACWPIFTAFVEGTNIVRAMPTEVAAELTQLRLKAEELGLLKEQLIMTLDGLGMRAIRVREGGGAENLGASIAVTLGSMLKKEATAA